MRNALAILLLFAPLVRADFFSKGNHQFDQGNLPRAILAYRQQVNTGRVSPALHYNLGNAYFQQGSLGQSIYHFHHAHLLAPRDADIRANLKFARDTVHGQRPRPNAGLALLGTLTLNEWSILAAIALSLWLLLAAIGQWRLTFGKAARPFTVLAGGTAVLLAILTALAWWGRTTNRIAVVVAGEVVARHTPWADAKPKFNLADGEEIRVVRRHKGWTMVEDQADRWGWMPSDQLQSLRHN